MPIMVWTGKAALLLSQVWVIVTELDLLSGQPGWAISTWSSQVT